MISVAGLEDILKLHDFSEMSLTHTLRVRYGRVKFVLTGVVAYFGDTMCLVTPGLLLLRAG